MKKRMIVFLNIVSFTIIILLSSMSDTKVLADNNKKTVEDGTYIIKSAINEKYVLDVPNNSKESGANINLWTDNSGLNQRFTIKYLGDGYYSITNVNSKKAVDVYGNFTSPETNVQQYEPNNSDAQKWKIESAGNGYYYFIAKSSGLCLDVFGGTAENGKNVQIYNKHGSNGQKFKLEMTGTKTIDEGTYSIRTKNDSNYAIDVDNASKENCANVLLWQNTGNDNQKFKLKYNTRGFYTITALHSNKVLDVEGGAVSSGKNVDQYSNNNGDNQKWIIKKEGDYYTIVSAINNMYLTVNNGNIDVESNKSSNFQKWIIDDGKNHSNNETEKTSNNTTIKGTKTIEDGTYLIKSKLDKNYVLDVCEASKENTANINLWSKTNGANQNFEFKYNENGGYYTITAFHSGKVLDVEGGIGKNGINVDQFSSNNGDNQKWIVEKNGEDYSIKSVSGGVYLNVQGNKAANGQNINVENKNESDGQKFIIEAEKNETKSNIETVGGEKTIEDGSYVIKTAIDENFVFDVPGASKDNGTDIKLWKDNLGINQRFNVKYIGDGCYTLTNENSNKMIDIDGTSYQSESNIEQYESNNTESQKWIIKNAGGGYYYIISKVSGLYMDVYRGQAKNGTKLEVYTPTESINQKFKFELIGEKTIDSGFYNIKTALNQNYTLDIYDGSKNDCANLMIWPSTYANNQKFKVVYHDRGYYTITAVHSRKALDIAGGVGANGLNVEQFEPHNGNNQKWVIKKNGEGYSIISVSGGVYLNVQGQNAQPGSNINVEFKNNSNSQKFVLERTTPSIDIDSGRYPGFKERIEQLMSNYPEWEFEFLYTGKSFNEVIDGEAELITRNLLPNTYGGEWILNDTPQDTGSWYPASKMAIRHYMDPRNFLNDVDIFQFKDVNEYNEDACTEGGIWNRVSGSYLSDYVSDIINACRNQGVDPYYVIARLIQEQGWGGASTWRMNGYSGTVYNPFNIGASGNSRSEVNNNAYNRAASSGWYSMQSAIEGGIYFLKINYLENYQNTLYTNKFDIDTRKSRLYSHQYMQNLLAAYNEARNLRSFYNSDGKLHSNFRFIIPLYENM